MTQPQPDTGASTIGTLARAYVPAEFEQAIYEQWLAADVFAPDGAGSTAEIFGVGPSVCDEQEANAASAITHTSARVARR